MEKQEEENKIEQNYGAISRKILEIIEKNRDDKKYEEEQDER